MYSTAKVLSYNELAFNNYRYQVTEEKALPGIWLATGVFLSTSRLLRRFGLESRLSCKFQTVFPRRLCGEDLVHLLQGNLLRRRFDKGAIR